MEKSFWEEMEDLSPGHRTPRMPGALCPAARAARFPPATRCVAKLHPHRCLCTGAIHCVTSGVGTPGFVIRREAPA